MKVSPILATLLVMAPLPGAAQTPMSPEDFERFSAGRTLYFTRDGQPYGAEQYFPGRRTLWRLEDGGCVEGVWDTDGDRICFVYDTDFIRQCWQFLRNGSSLRAALVEDGAPTGFALDYSHADTKPLGCPGPSVGS